MPSVIVDEFGRPFPSRREREVHALRARVDAASSSDESKRHWANTDALGPNAAFSEATRWKLRNRARYESLNNSYCRGLVRSMAYDLIGTCPRLQLSIPATDGRDFTNECKQIEKAFAVWTRSIMFGLKCRLMEKGAARCGESFGILGTNPKRPGPVKLDLRLIEPEQCETPPGMTSDPLVINGVRIDAYGNKEEYYFLHRHPGEIGIGLTAMTDPYKWITVPADQVLHWYEIDRPGQLRGIPRITASLPLCSQLRRFTLATLAAAEVAAMLAGIMKSTLPPESGQAVQVDQWEMVELVRGTLLTLPEGWDASQFRPEQPATTYPEFKREILNEIGRGTGAPLNMVSGNSSGYNFSSGRLDHLPYHRGLRVERHDFRAIVNDPVFLAWVEEMDAAQLLPVGLPSVEKWAWDWNYDGFDGIDQNKDAMADDTRIKNGTQTYAETYSAYGQDWREQFEQLAREKAYAEELGLPWPVLAAPPVKAAADGAAAPADQASPEDQAPPEPPTRRAPPKNGYHRNGHVGGVH